MRPKQTVARRVTSSIRRYNNITHILPGLIRRIPLKRGNTRRFVSNVVRWTVHMLRMLCWQQASVRDEKDQSILSSVAAMSPAPPTFPLIYEMEKSDKRLISCNDECCLYQN